MHARFMSVVILALSLGLAACSGTPRHMPAKARPTEMPAPSSAAHMPAQAAPPTPSAPGADGPSDTPPAQLESLPDPVPRVEAVREGGPNKPYQVQGQSFRPERGDPAMVERGIASWYGRAFHGRRTASGEVYDMHALTAAHKTMPIPSYARVINPANGREVIVRVNDRGPFIAGRIIDLSYAAAVKLGTSGGVASVEVERITHEAIRSGAWRRGDGDAMARTRPTPAARAATAVPVPAQQTVAVAAAAPQPLAAAPANPAAPQATASDLALTSPPNPAPTSAQPAYTDPARGFWLQLGAFTQAPGAQDFRRRVEALATWLSPLLAVFDDKGLHRLQAGPYASRDEAQAALQRLRAELQLVALLVQRR